MLDANMSVAASLDRVTVRLGSIEVLRGVDLEIAGGEVTALLGLNGAGKTTALRVLTGRLRPDSGRAQLFGTDPRSAGARARTGVMLQTVTLPDMLKVAELVALHSGYYATARPIAETLRLAGLEHLASRRIARLSGGENRRLQYALAICGNPDLLVLDEPTTGMDHEARRSLWTTIREETDNGTAVLLTTHYIDEAEVLADRIVIIANGRIVADGTTATIRATVAGSTIRCRTVMSIEALRTMSAVRHVDRSGGESRIVSADAAATLRDLFAADVQCSDLRIAAASLEDAICSITTRKLAAAA